MVENSNEEMGFGEESWEEISGDTLGDVGEQRMTTLEVGWRGDRWQDDCWHGNHLRHKERSSAQWELLAR